MELEKNEIMQGLFTIKLHKLIDIFKPFLRIRYFCLKKTYETFIDL